MHNMLLLCLSHHNNSPANCAGGCVAPTPRDVILSISATTKTKQPFQIPLHGDSWGSFFLLEITLRDKGQSRGLHAVDEKDDYCGAAERGKEKRTPFRSDFSWDCCRILGNEIQFMFDFFPVLLPQLVSSVFFKVPRWITKHYKLKG